MARDTKQPSSQATNESEQLVRLQKAFADLQQKFEQRTRELREALEQQAATSEVLRVISSSPGELEPVFSAMLENATHLCEARFGEMFLHKSEAFHSVALHGVPPALGEFRAKNPPIRPPAHIPLARAVKNRMAEHVADVRLERGYGEGYPPIVALADLGGAKTLLIVPLVKENEVLGTINIYRQEVRPFTKRQVALVINFASQAVIAIANTRLLRDLRQRTDDLSERTRELSQSLDDLRNAQDRLVQTEKLASLGQLTAGIAHEIKNPLNFVNNFSALSAELIDELDDVMKSIALDGKVREELYGLTHILKGNLEKVVQHGKRADSIVKNMLQHSREGSGEWRSADINALVAESLNLAYHGARAEKPGFAVALKHDLDPNAGALELYPQEITRALLNLISNGFYAAARRKSEAGDESLEPTLSATTKNLGNKVEIRIRDNGAGILPEVKEKIFNPFFTTKPTGEGTGLGLSMSYDIIVKQHGGRIDVETALGQFTEFIVTLPRDGRTASDRKSE